MSVEASGALRASEACEWSVARTRAHLATGLMPAYSIPLSQAEGHILVEPLIATEPRPAFDNAAMDGYAVRGGPPWLISGATRAGGDRGTPLDDRHGREVAMGARIPANAEAVIPYEDARLCGRILSGARASRDHIRRVGEEAAPGDVVVPAGRIVTPMVQAAAAALSYDHVVVLRRPQVVALLTGDEVVDRGVPGPGLVRDAIGPLLPGLTDFVGGELVRAQLVRDGAELLMEAVAAAQADIVLVSGSSSVGRGDSLRAVADLMLRGASDRGRSMPTRGIDVPMAVA